MASKRAIRRKACGTKRRFDEVAPAKHAVHLLKRDGKLTGAIDVYWCQFCGGVHIGHRRGQKHA